MRHTTKAALALIAGLAVAATSAGLLPAEADTDVTSTVVATGLNNPRHLSFGAGQTFYVAEAGTGGDGACVTNPEDPQADICLGMTGSITEVSGKRQTRVITDLPSLAGADGGSATGPTDVIVRGNNAAVVIGLGGNQATRDALGPDGAGLGTIMTGRLGRTLTIAADVSAHEEAANPAGGDIDSNPGGFIGLNTTTWVVADAGGNSLVQSGTRSGSQTLAVFPNGSSSPPFQSVPTDVAQGNDGAFYVSELTGFPFPAGASRIWKVVPGQAPVVYATGLTNVTGLAWQHDTLYAVQISDAGLASGQPPFGSLRRVVPGSTNHPVVLGDLFMPYGVAIHGKTAYVTVNSTSAGGGEVHAVSLR